MRKNGFKKADNWLDGIVSIGGEIALSVSFIINKNKGNWEKSIWFFLEAKERYTVDLDGYFKNIKTD